MSIYGSMLDMSDGDHEDGCAVWKETSPCVFEISGKPCDCGLPRAPIVYEGSHVLPSDDDPRGGSIDVADIPDFIERVGRSGPYDWLRLSVHNVPSITRYEGEPYVSGGDAAVVLDRSNVERLRDCLTGWLEREGEL